MAQPHPQTGLSNSPGAAGQPQIAQRQAPIGEKNLNPQQFQQPQSPQSQQLQPQQLQAQRVVQAPVKPAPAPPPVDDDPAGSDWGLAPTKPGFSRENKFILFVLLVLVAVFSFVVFRNFQKKQGGTTPAEVAAKEGKDAKKSEKPGADEPQALAEPGADDEPGSHPKLTQADTAADPFGAGAAPDQGTGEVAGGNAADFATESNATESNTVAGNESEARPQLNATTDQAEVPAQGQEAFEGSSDPAVEALPVSSRRHGRNGHRQRPGEGPVSEVATGEAAGEIVEETTQQPETAQFQEPAVIEENTEAVGAADFTQTGGESAAQPIRQRGSAGSANQINVAQNTNPVNVAAPPEEIAQTTPRTTVPRTAPRTGTGTRGAASTPPPPLDSNDPRLGGYREGELVPTTTTRHRAGRAPAGSQPFDPQQEPLVANVGEYIVRPNDNYWRISRKVYGTARYFAALARHNETHVPDSKHMKPGIKISTPPKEQLERDYGDLVPAVAPARPVGAVVNPPNAPKTPGYFVDSDGQPAYRIGSTDTLSSISHRTLGRSSRWDEIFELNRDRLAGADSLIVGAILRLPPDASQTRVVSKPVEIR